MIEQNQRIEITAIKHGPQFGYNTHGYYNADLYVVRIPFKKMYLSKYVNRSTLHTFKVKIC